MNETIEYAQVVDEVKKDEIYESIIKADEILPILIAEANSKKLEVFLYDGEELKEFYTPKYEDLVIAVISKNKDCANWNLQNKRHCYIMKK